MSKLWKGGLALGASLALAWTVGAPVQASPSQNPDNGHYYELIIMPRVELFGGGIDWSTANTAATGMIFQGTPGHLATITSSTENGFVASLLPPVVPNDILFRSWWLGGLQPDGSPEPAGNWQWVTGEPFAYTNWANNEPNNFDGGEDRLSVYQPGVWNDVFGTRGYDGYLVEYDVAPVPEPASLTLLAGGALGLLRFRRRQTRNVNE
jgi:hypothetical protein